MRLFHVVLASCGCGGSRAWVELLPDRSQVMHGCICHNTLPEDARILGDIDKAEIDRLWSIPLKFLTQPVKGNSFRWMTHPSASIDEVVSEVLGYDEVEEAWLVEFESLPRENTPQILLEKYPALAEARKHQVHIIWDGQGWATKQDVLSR